MLRLVPLGRSSGGNSMRKLLLALGLATLLVVLEVIAVYAEPIGGCCAAVR